MGSGPYSFASAADSSARALTPGLRQAAVRCFSTVLGLTYNGWAMSRLKRPAAARAATRRSLVVGASIPLSCGRRGRGPAISSSLQARSASGAAPQRIRPRRAGRDRDRPGCGPARLQWRVRAVHLVAWRQRPCPENPVHTRFASIPACSRSSRTCPLRTTTRSAGGDSCFSAKELSWRTGSSVRSLLSWTTRSSAVAAGG